jgi:hypothetical protein
MQAQRPPPELAVAIPTKLEIVMRNFLIPLMLVASLGGVSVAMAAETAQGKIHALDAKACTVTLDGSKTAYHFAPKCDFSKLKVGERVAIKWMTAGNVRMASAITAG